MNKNELQTNLLNWYQKYQRELPWRKTTDPYKIWISEVMLQQTQVKTVIPYYHRFAEKFPTVIDLARANQQDVLKTWEGLGYYSRARNLHKAARIITEEHSGKIPDIPADLQKLPGVGDYICAAVMSIAFQKPMAVVDGNVKRVLARLFCLPDPVNDAKAKTIFSEKADFILNGQHSGDHNQAMMELGATICSPQNPFCENCPVRQDCQAFQTTRVAEFPRRIVKEKTPLYHIAIGVVYKAGKMLITKRKDNGLLGGLWEFPGGKRKIGEAAETACLREIKEETGLTVTIRTFLKNVHHTYTHFRVSIDVYICDYVSGEVNLNGPVDFQWIHYSEIPLFPFPKSNHKFMDLLQD